MAALTINGKKYWSNNVKVTKTHIKLDNDTIPIKELTVIRKFLMSLLVTFMLLKERLLKNWKHVQLIYFVPVTVSEKVVKVLS